MQKIILFITSILIVHVSTAQITFQKLFGNPYESAYSMQQTTDGGYIIAGSTSAYGAGLSDLYLIKTDSIGDTLWTKTYGGPNVEQGYSVQQTSDGGYIVTGVTYALGVGNQDVYLIKTDANGNLLWAKSFGGIGDDVSISVQQTADGGYIIAGNTTSAGAWQTDLYVIKTDANGDSVWIKTFGWLGDEYGQSVTQTIDGGYMIAGSTSSFGAGNSDVYLVKINANGNYLWSKTYGSIDWDGAIEIQQTTDSGFIITGTYSNGFDTNVYLIKTDINGDTLWTKSFGGLNPDVGFSVQQTFDGGYIVGGYAISFGAGNADCYLIKTNSNGDYLWSKTYGGFAEDYAYAVKQTTDGGYVLGGYSRSFPAYYNKIYIIKTDVNGNSNCNEGNPGTIEIAHPTQVTNAATIATVCTTFTSTPLVITGYGGNIQTLCLSVGINEMASKYSAEIFPNPSSGNFIISFNSTIIKGNIEITDMLGNKIYSENILNESKMEINLTLISKGIYVVKIFDGEIFNFKKIIVE